MVMLVSFHYCECYTSACACVCILIDKCVYMLTCSLCVLPAITHLIFALLGQACAYFPKGKQCGPFVYVFGCC